MIFDDFLSLFRFLDATVAKDSKLFSPGQASATRYSGQPWVIFRKNTVQSHFTVISAVFWRFCLSVESGVIYIIVGALENLLEDSGW